MKHLLILTCMLGLAGSAVAQQSPQDADKPVFSLSKKQFEGIKSGLKIAAKSAVAFYLMKEPLEAIYMFVHNANENKKDVNLLESMHSDLVELLQDADYEEERAVAKQSLIRLTLGGYMLWNTYKSIRKALPAKKVAQK